MELDGFSHIGLSTLDVDATVHFYEEVLGLERLVHSVSEIEQGGAIEEFYFEIGNGQYLVFMAPKEVQGIPDEYDTGINRGLGVPSGMYHFAFNVKDIGELGEWKARLQSCNIDVSDVIDLDTIKAIFFVDPNGIQLEISTKAREFEASDLQRKSKVSLAQ